VTTLRAWPSLGAPVGLALGNDPPLRETVASPPASPDACRVVVAGKSFRFHAWKRGGETCSLRQNSTIEQAAVALPFHPLPPLIPKILIH
jgi:hypothetical protein